MAHGGETLSAFPCYQVAKNMLESSRPAGDAEPLAGGSRRVAGLFCYPAFRSANRVSSSLCSAIRRAIPFIICCNFLIVCSGGSFPSPSFDSLPSAGSCSIRVHLRLNALSATFKSRLTRCGHGTESRSGLNRRMISPLSSGFAR
jgi:hypothetical protein